MNPFSTRARIGLAVLGATVVLSACGGGSSGGSSGGDAVADTAAAKSQIAPYVGKPSAFPVNTPLAKSAAGKRVAVLDCGTTVCGLFTKLVQPAAAALGMQVTPIKAGLAADSVAAAFNTVVQSKYDGVFVPAIQPSLWRRGLDQLVQARIPVVTTGVVGGDPAKIGAYQTADPAIALAGKLLAAYVVDQTGKDTDVAFYVTPEIAFNTILGQAFQDQMKVLCARCETRTVKVPASTLGTRAPALIVDDLQAHPKTKTAVFALADQAVGLPAALKVAGVQVKTLVTFPDPGALTQIKSGQLDAGLGIDLPVIAWTLMDSLARLTTGQPVAPGVRDDRPPMQFLTKADLPGDVSKGWTGYPDFADRYGKLWGAAA